MTYINAISDPKNKNSKKTLPTISQTEEIPGSQNGSDTLPNISLADQEIIELDNLEDIEFLLDEIEDQIAPLAL